MRCGIVSLSHLGRTGTWSVGINLDLVELEKVMASIGHELEKGDSRRFDVLANLIQEANEKNKSVRSKVNTVILDPDLMLIEKADDVAARIIKEPMLSEYLSENRGGKKGRMHDLWLRFFTEYATHVIRVKIDQNNEETSRLEAVTEKIKQQYKKNENIPTHP